MWSGNALADARDLARSPGLASHLRQRPLPPDVLIVIRLAWGCPETTRDAVASTGDDAVFLKAAGELYVQHVLCFQGADPHRTLGVRPFATREQMRLHMRQLMLCLHPDRLQNEWRTASAARVLAAWSALSRHPQAQAPVPGQAKAAGPRGRDRTYKPPWVPRPVASQAQGRSQPSRRRRGLQIAVVVCGLLFPDALASEAPVPPGHDALGVPDAAPPPASAPTLLSTAPPDEQAR